MDSLETRAELAVLHTCVEKRSILEPRHQNVNEPKSRAESFVYGIVFLSFYKIIVNFFSFLCQDAMKTRSTCPTIGCNLSKKHKLTQHKTRNGKSNYVDHKFFFNFYQELPTCKKPSEQTSKYYRAA